MSDENDDKRDGAPEFGGDIKPIAITDEMKKSYLDYAMSVIVSRALPDVRDGMKPVHRRILYSMWENNHTPDRKHVKSANIVGSVMGQYHPHGDQAIYDALVRMAQPFSLRLPLVDGQGNFGSIDGDPPAAMRYTESRLDKSAMPLLDDLGRDTVDFQPNYDDSREEPSVLPAQVPAAAGQRRGRHRGRHGDQHPAAQSRRSHRRLLRLHGQSRNLDRGAEPGHPRPGLPDRGLDHGPQRHPLRLRDRARLHRDAGQDPYRGAAQGARGDRRHRDSLSGEQGDDGREDRRARAREAHRGISDLRDESSREGIRVVIEIKRDAVADVVLNQLYRFTPLQTSFGANMVALNGGRPEVLNLKDFISAFVEFREEVVSRRTRYLLNKARERAHVLCGLATAVANIDEVIRLIRTAPTPNDAHESLMARDWPAGDIAPLIALVDDPRHPMNPTAPTGSPTRRPRPSSSCASPASPPSAATR